MRHRHYFLYISLILIVGLSTMLVFRYLVQLPSWLVAVVFMAMTAMYIYFFLLRSRPSDASVIAHEFPSERLDILSEAAATIAHEMTNPVTYIDSNLNGLGDDLKAYNEFIGLLDKASDHLDIREPFYQEALKAYQSLDIANVSEHAPQRLRDSLEGIQRLLRMIEDLSSLSESNRVDLRTADINSELPQVFTNARATMPEGVTLSTCLIKVPAFPCNPVRIAQVVQNMLNNAITALHNHGGHISVREMIDGQNLIIEIADDGCGMSPEVMKRAFEPFFTTCSVGKGSGIGLALCYKLIREHNGEIHVQSREGRGTSFSLAIPIQYGESTHVD